MRYDLYEIDEIIGTVLRRLHGRIQSHHVVLELPKALPSVSVDGKLIEQVFENIIDNATKYTPRGSDIRISASANDKQIEIIVSDNGPGFEDVAPETLFEKFERGKKETAIGGVGLGLAICRAIVNLHRGRIWAEECQPHGAAIHVVLPLSAGDSKLVEEDD